VECHTAGLQLWDWASVRASGTHCLLRGTIWRQQRVGAPAASVIPAADFLSAVYLFSTMAGQKEPWACSHVARSTCQGEGPHLHGRLHLIGRQPHRREHVGLVPQHRCAAAVAAAPGAAAPGAVRGGGGGGGMQPFRAAAGRGAGSGAAAPAGFGTLLALDKSTSDLRVCAAIRTTTRVRKKPDTT